MDTPWNSFTPGSRVYIHTSTFVFSESPMGENAGADAKVPDEKPRSQFRRETTSSTIERVKPKKPAPMLTAHSEAGLLSSSIAIERHRAAHEDAAALLATPRDPDPWTQSLRPADLLSLAAEAAEEKEGMQPAPPGLPWSTSDAWELSDSQLRLLSFELLLLSRPSPEEPEPETEVLPPPSPVRVLRGASAVRRAQLAQVLSVRIVRSLSDLDDEHEIASLPALLHPPPRAPDKSALALLHEEDATDAATDLADAHLAEGASSLELMPFEEPLETQIKSRLATMAEQLGPQMESATSAAADWWTRTEWSMLAWAHRSGAMLAWGD